MTARTVLHLDRFLLALASARPAPGGGSAAALAGAIGCALGAKVGRVIGSRPKLMARRRAKVRATVGKLNQLTRLMERLIKEDAKAYEGLVRALKRKKGVGPARRRAIQIPFMIASRAQLALRELAGLDSIAGSHLGCDLKAAREFLKSASRSASYMVEANQ
jgi:formiminotetrahydrofolate cyclodeaminase